MSDINLNYLKGQVKSVSDLKQLANKHHLNYSDDDLEVAFKALNMDLELSDESLRSVCGGQGEVVNDDFKLIMDELKRIYEQQIIKN